MMALEKPRTPKQDVRGFTKRDLIFSVATGLITGFSVWRILVFLNVPKFGGVSYAWL